MNPSPQKNATITKYRTKARLVVFLIYLALPFPDFFRDIGMSFEF